MVRRLARAGGGGVAASTTWGRSTPTINQESRAFRVQLYPSCRTLKLAFRVQLYPRCRTLKLTFRVQLYPRCHTLKLIFLKGVVCISSAEYVKIIIIMKLAAGAPK